MLLQLLASTALLNLKRKVKKIYKKKTSSIRTTMRPINVRMKEFSWIYLNLLEFTCIYLNLLEFTRIYLNSPFWKKYLTDRRTNRRTNGRTDGWTDKASYRDAWTHLKTSESEKDVQRCLLKWPDKKHCFCDAEQNRNKILKFIHIITVCILLSF